MQVTRCHSLRTRPRPRPPSPQPCMHARNLPASAQKPQTCIQTPVSPILFLEGQANRQSKTPQGSVCTQGPNALPKPPTSNLQNKTQTFCKRLFLTRHRPPSSPSALPPPRKPSAVFLLFFSTQTL
ncbi:hypothetical protein BS50DRAFT_312511 [Corynespora cassiicola Philippines]|uniref:Uncharacterized protein n=1 Tax=Corynespora cassiicola Philippines TaxID=1448308 RepID=A0A2T2NYD5_CORCC|nr:hypothetical protein BS50DRAFT_312511 [Corynespora cassiicola Philippines]